MKTRDLWIVVGISLLPAISSAQDAENSNPYAIFGRAPYVAGERKEDANAENLFVIENAAEGSEVSRMEHDPKTGRVRLLDKHGKLLRDKFLKAGESGWLTQDQFAEKYYPVSPYAFCLNNPVRFIDPNGQEVWIYYQDDDDIERRLLYTANMEYQGSNSFVSNMVSNLNAVYANGGSNMLDFLIGSKNAYNVVNQVPGIDGAGGSFRRNMEGGGKIYAGKIGTGFDYGSVETTAHEFMHGAQHELGQGGPSIFNEVEAYVFGYGVAKNYAGKNGDVIGSMSSLGVGDTPASKAWENAFEILRDRGYSGKAMVDAINNFKAGAQVNQFGQYNHFPMLPKPYNGGKLKSTLSGFWRP